MQQLTQKCIAEFGGTFLLCLVVLTTHNYLAIGAALAIGVFLGGGAYNPAVAVSLLMNKEISAKEIVVFIVVEFIAAISAYYASKALLSLKYK
jgi:glycerol uptake facilitator-like aquaporin